MDINGKPDKDFKSEIYLYFIHFACFFANKICSKVDLNLDKCWWKPKGQSGDTGTIGHNTSNGDKQTQHNVEI